MPRICHQRLQVTKCRIGAAVIGKKGNWHGQVFGPNEIQVGVQTPTTRKEESQRRKCLELPAEVREGAA